MKIGFDPLHTTPRDPVARKVVYAKGDHYDPKIKSDKHLYSTDALPIRSLDNLPYKIKNDPNFSDLSGLKIGYFTVMGLLKCAHFDKWVLRCSCGNYEIRTAKTLKKITDKADQNRCQSCLDLERLRNLDYRREHGIYPWQQVVHLQKR